MIIDRYVKLVLTVIAAALVLIAVRPWVPGADLLNAVRPHAAQAQGPAAKYEVALPKAWGKVIGFGNNNLLMEAPDQTLRVVDIEGKAPEYPKLKVQVRWQ